MYLSPRFDPSVGCLGQGVSTGLGGLIYPSVGSVYDETGTPDSGYAENGPYHCEDCIHKTSSDEPFCVHPRIVGDHQLQDRLVQIDGRPVIKVDMEHGCCRFVNQPLCEDSDGAD